MLRLTQQQRAALGETLRELANLTAGALALSQFVGQQSLSGSLLLAAAATWFVLVGVALLLVGGKGNV